MGNIHGVKGVQEARVLPIRDPVAAYPNLPNLACNTGETSAEQQVGKKRPCRDIPPMASLFSQRKEMHAWANYPPLSVYRFTEWQRS